MKIQLEEINKSDLSMHVMTSQIFDALDRKIEQQRKYAFHINQKHEHLRCVVLEKILQEDEDGQTV